MEIIPRNGIFVAIFLCIGVANTVAYSKFGRKCSDIGCPSNQVCVLVNEPCTRGNNGNCGSYPTCTNKPAGGGAHEESKDVLYPQNSASAPEPGHSNNSPVPSAPVSLPNQPSKPSGYPTGSVYPPNPSGGASYPSYSSSAPSYPSSGSSYPSYPSSGSSYPSYPSSGSSYPNYPSSGSGYPADATRKQNMGTVNAGYPSTGQPAQYPAGGSYYPQGGYPQSNYPQSGYPQNSYQGQYPQNPYPGQYPQNPYQGQYPQQPQKPKKPSFTDQLTNFAKNIATRVLTQAVVDKVSG
ncbi:calcium-binding protein P-like isoform X2 [Cotesia glomerata]|uniref:calcium-binding protein P-like isoform X2 n=1 Tax=Cotesia glomerata TaxID=32391 RepID=UPI001D016EF0|nr:calcium-binding protein P-like isoform X2 [Cotesia glomerata]